MGNVSSFLSNGEGGQFFPLQRCQLEGPHLHRNVEVCSERENEQIINYCRHRDVFPHSPLYRICKTYINGTMILTEKMQEVCSLSYQWGRKTWFPDTSQINVCSIIPIKPKMTRVQHSSLWSVGCRHVLSKVCLGAGWIDCYIWHPLWNDTLLKW